MAEAAKALEADTADLKSVFYFGIERVVMIYTNVCKHCHAVFRSKIRTFCCKECRSEDEDQLDDIVEYLRLYPNSNALQISEELGMHPYVILKYMEEGWLTQSHGSFSKLPDENR